MEKRLSVGFIGTGKMATALATNWSHSGLVEPKSSLGSDPSEASREAFADATGFRVTQSNSEVWSHCPVIILAVKPQVVEAVLSAGLATHDHLVISIAAGIVLKDLERWSGGKSRFVRVMPNTPALVGKGAAGFARGHKTTDSDMDLVLRLLNSVGQAFPVPEVQLDAVTGLSGSGPAYVYQFIEALSDGGVLTGLPREVATRLAAQTVLGAAAMVLETGSHPGQLKDMVTSPGGTTIAGLHALEQGGFRGIVMDAVLSATNRATELGQNPS